MRKLLSWSIRTQLFTLLTVMTIVPMGILLTSAFHQRAYDIREARLLVERLADEISDDQNMLLSGTEQLLSTLSQLPAVQRHDTPAVNTLLAGLVKNNPQYSNLLVMDRNGLLWASAVPVQGTISYADRRYFRNAMASGRFSSGEFGISRTINKPVMNFSYPIKDAAGNITDLAVVAFTPEKYARQFKTNVLPANTSLLMTDHKGTILFNVTAPQTVGRQDRDDLFRLMTAGGDKATFEAISNTGIPRFFAYQKLRLGGEQTPYMYVRAGMPVETVLGKTRSKLLVDLGLMSLMLFLATGFAYVIIKRGIVDKIMALRDAAQNVARGNLGVSVANLVSGGELGELGRAFDNMSETLARRETALQKSEERFRSFVENATDIVFSLSSEGIITYVSPNWQDACGYEPAETIGTPFARFIHPDDVATSFASLQRGLATGDKQEHVEYRLRHKNGTWIWYSANESSFHDPDSNTVSMLGIGRDISRQKHAEELLRTSETLLKESQRVAHVGHYVFDITTGRWSSSEELDAIFGIDDDYLRDVPGWLQIVCSEQREELATYLEMNILQEHRDFNKEYRIARISDQAVRWVRGLGHLEFAPDGTLVKMFGVIQDITESRRAEEAFHFQFRQISTIFDALSVIVHVVDPGTSELVYLNKYGASIFGSHWQGRPCHEVLRCGNPRPCKLNEWQVPARSCEINVQHVYDYRNGFTNRWYHCVEKEMSWTDGRQLDITVATDITDLKDMMQMQDDLLSAVSHEMRTPLTAINGYTEFLLENRVDARGVHEYLGIIQSESERLTELLDNFLNLQRLKTVSAPGRLTPQFLAPLLAETAVLYGERSTTHRIVTSFPPELPPVLGDRKQLQLLLSNLVANAVKYSPNGGEIVIGARRDDQESITLWVRDEGIGISPDVQEKIFDKFYQVESGDRRSFGGIGLGLALVKEIVHACHGRIWVESTLGKGSIFYVSFPLAHDSAS
jgi:PAS domain S-box-containing protein